VTELDGCRAEPLGTYLQGLGVWRAVVRLLDPHARAYWRAGRLVLDTEMSVEDLTEALHDRYAPLSVVSPWNAGSGFLPSKSNVSATRALAEVRASTEPRLAALRRAVQAADQVVATGRKRGWGGSGDDAWDKAHKADVIMLCRNELPDDALPWIDTAVVLSADELGGHAAVYSRLLGTGANFGRQDLSATYVRAALDVLDRQGAGASSRGWLRAVLSGDESTPYQRGPVGQFDPGRAGGVQSSPFEKADDNGFANPWAFLFTIEGAVLFASAATRRAGAMTGRVAVPFMVRASPVGYAGSATGESVHAEFWAPLWDRPASLPEVERLLGEGRAEWGGRPARSGLDFVRAVAALGVDRGVSGFTRYVISERLGQNPLAVPVGRFTVRAMTGPLGLLRQIDPWLDRVRDSAPPAEIEERLRNTDAAIFEVAAAGAGPDQMRAVVIALGRLHQAVSRSSVVRARVWPLTIRRTRHWWPALSPDTPELRLAAALASGSDAVPRAMMAAGSPGGSASGRGEPYVTGSLRLLLTPVQFSRSGAELAWTDHPAPVPLAGDIVAVLAAAHRRRAVPGAVNDPYSGDRAADQAAIKGVLSAYRRGLPVGLDDVVALATGEIDAAALGDYLAGMLLFDWAGVSAPPADPPDRAPVLYGPLALLLPFFGVNPLPVRLRAEDTMPSAVVLRPGTGWLAGLHSTNQSWVYEDAVRRLRAAGITRTVTPRFPPVDGDALTAALLVRIGKHDRRRALRGAASLPRPVPVSVKGDAA
jgi:CRISPR-associated protein Csx17